MNLDRQTSSHYYRINEEDNISSFCRLFAFENVLVFTVGNDVVPQTPKDALLLPLPSPLLRVHRPPTLSLAPPALRLHTVVEVLPLYTLRLKPASLLLVAPDFSAVGAAFLQSPALAGRPHQLGLRLPRLHGLGAALLPQTGKVVVHVLCLFVESVPGVERVAARVVVLLLNRTVAQVCGVRPEARGVQRLFGVRFEVQQEGSWDLPLADQVPGHVADPRLRSKDVVGPQTVHVNFIEG